MPSAIRLLSGLVRTLLKYLSIIPLRHVRVPCFSSTALNKTLETLDQVKHSGDTLAPNSALPDPELYIIVNGKPTKTKVVWRTLADVNHVRAAIRKLKESNGSTRK